MVNTVEMIERLMRCGYRDDTAMEICRRYLTEQDAEGLTVFVRTSELMTDDRREYAEDV